MDRKQLIDCFQHTLWMCESPMLRKATETARNSTRVYVEGFKSKWPKFVRSAEFEKKDFITVKEGSTFAVAKEYAGRGKVGVLNFANPHYPGGAVADGAMAQEECLCRSSNLYPCLRTEVTEKYYYAYHRQNKDNCFSDRVIYTDHVTVFKTDHEIPIPMPEKEWFQVSVLSCAAPYTAEKSYTNKKVLEEIFKRRITNVFEVAIHNNIHVLILGAFGCGAFQNPPDVVASAFHQVIKENRVRYQKRFDKIVFAIKRTAGSNPVAYCPNIAAFETEFYGVSGEMCKERFSGGTPAAYAYGDAVMPGGRIHKAGSDALRYFEWRRKNKYYGKQFSVLGDSISTLEGFHPKGYRVFYESSNAGVTNIRQMKDTWWGKVIDYFGGELLVNNSWSGSRVTKLPNSNQIFPSACSDERAGGLHVDHVKPDVIMIYMGTNDWAFGARSDLDTHILGVDEEEYFGSAYSIMLKKIRKNYPDAEIWCCTLSSTYMSSNSEFTFPEIYYGSDISYYNYEIRENAQKYGCKLIELFKNRIPYNSVDGSHPNAEGMNTLAVQVIRAICDKESGSFLDCLTGHQYITVGEKQGSTEYICKKCGKLQWTGEVSQEDKILKIFVGSAGEERVFRQELVTVGRDEECDIKLESQCVSRKHARFYYKDSNWYIVDTDSTNGVWLNGNRLEKNKGYKLFDDDEIDIAHKEKLYFYKEIIIAASCKT